MNSPRLVMKFGGTSVGSPAKIRRAAALCAEASRAYRPIVVSSAMAKVTDLLLDTLKAGERGDEVSVEDNIAALERRHLEAAAELIPAEGRERVVERIGELLERFSKTARGMLLLGERPPRSVDAAAATGERLSTLLIAETLAAMGVPAEPVDAARLIVTDDDFGAAAPLTAETAVKARAGLEPLLSAGVIPIVSGFNAATVDGRSTTLGRGGSDFSAAILAAAMDAAELWIWTDVDGILSGDPRIVPDARILPHVTYNEAAELAYAGAQVLHPRTLAPVVEKDIPVWIKNSFRPEAPGTLINGEAGDARGVRAITSLRGVTMISIEAVSASQSGAQLMSCALGAVARAKVEVLLLTRSSFRQNFSMVVRSGEVDAVLESLRDELSLELAHGYLQPIQIDESVGLLATVGEGMRGTAGLAGKLFTSISEREINIIAIAQGSSELTIAIVVREDDLEDAVRAVHAECCLGRPQPESIAPRA